MGVAPGAYPYAPQMTREQELDLLRSQAEALESELDVIRKRLEELCK
jgi:prefoldin subunit 5